VILRISDVANAWAKRVTHSEYQASVNDMRELGPQTVYNTTRKPAWQRLRDTYAVNRGSFLKLPLAIKTSSKAIWTRALQDHRLST
jgi:hypothetical protein